MEDICNSKIKHRDFITYSDVEDIETIKSFDVVDATLDKLAEDMKEKQQQVVDIILKAHNLNMEYVKQFPEEFTIEETQCPNFGSKRCTIKHNNTELGQYRICIYEDYQNFKVVGEILYEIL